MTEENRFAVISLSTLRVSKFKTREELSDAILAIRRRSFDFVAFKYYANEERWVKYDSYG